MIPHLQDRAALLSEFGWIGRDAEWVALVCLHSGVFLRAQYLAFLGDPHPEHAARLVRRCGKAVAQERWSGSGLLCRIASRPVYRALGAEHLRHRRTASPAVVRRRLLSLDYVLERLDAPWLPTEREKVAGLTGAGIPEHVLPLRVYRGASSVQRRHFVQKLPIALDTYGATFVYVQAEDESPSALRTWGELHAPLWEALGHVDRKVAVVVVGRDPVRLAQAERVLDRWMSTPANPSASTSRIAQEGLRKQSEIESIRAAITKLDLVTLDRYGGLNGALARCAELETEMEAGLFPQAKPAVESGSTWRSRRVPA